MEGRVLLPSKSGDHSDPVMGSIGLIEGGFRAFAPVDPIRAGNKWYAYAGGDPVNYVDHRGLNRVFVSGGINAYPDLDEHDTMPLNFVVPVAYVVPRMIERVGELNPDENIEWFVHLESYRRRAKNEGKHEEYYVEKIRDMAAMMETESVKVILREYHDDNDLATLFNIAPSGGSRKGSEVITGAYFYGHGDASQWYLEFFPLGIRPGEADKRYERRGAHMFNVSEITSINRDAFQINAECISFACNTGADDDWNTNFASQWHNKLGVLMMGAVGKTNYAPTAFMYPGIRAKAWQDVKAAVGYEERPPRPALHPVLSEGSSWYLAGYARNPLDLNDGRWSTWLAPIVESK